MADDSSHRDFVDILSSDGGASAATDDDDGVHTAVTATTAAAAAPTDSRLASAGSTAAVPAHARFDRLMDFCRSDLIGRFHPFLSPLGWKPTVYADWTASGRAFRFVEDYIATRVLASYGNTHTSTSETGLQTSCYRHEARQIIAEAVNAHAKNDVVIFTGTGSTGAISTLCHVLGLGRRDDRPIMPLPLAETGDDNEGDGDDDEPSMVLPAGYTGVVFVGAYEHHSNLLPWRESGAKVVTIGLTHSGELDEVALESSLLAHALFRVRVGSFSAASNITGLLTNVDRISEILHRYGALACWDYATAAPYCPIDMNPVRARRERMCVRRCVGVCACAYVCVCVCVCCVCVLSAATQRLSHRPVRTPAAAAADAAAVTTDRHHHPPYMLTTTPHGYEGARRG